MVTYEEVVNELKALAEEKFSLFQRRIIIDSELEILGVRTPEMRKLAKKYKREYESFSAFPDEFYEVVFLKLSIAANLPYEEFILVSDSCSRLITDWALCDCFAPSCIEKHRDEYVPFIKKYVTCSEGFNGGEFVRRFALSTLLHFYVEKEYLGLIFECIADCHPEKYYVMMAAAWLLAEVLVKHYDEGLAFLQSTMCDKSVRNKAISKACDSYRIEKEQKDYLKSLKVKI